MTRLFKGSGAFFAGVGVGCAVVALAVCAGRYFGSPAGELVILAVALMLFAVLAERPSRTDATRPSDLPLKAEQPGYSRLDVPRAKRGGGR